MKSRLVFQKFLPVFLQSENENILWRAQGESVFPIYVVGMEFSVTASLCVITQVYESLLHLTYDWYGLYAAIWSCLNAVKCKPSYTCRGFCACLEI